MTKIRCFRGRGFTLIEVMIVVLILSIAMAVSLPMFVSAMNDAKTKQCRANMITIANSEEQYKIKSATHTYTTTLANLVGDLPVVPLCPNGGAYTVTISNGSATSQSGQTVANGGLVILCSASGHGKLAPSIDQQ